MADAITQENARRIEGQWNWGLWRRWVLVNTIGELIGLGAAAIVGVSLAQTVDTTMGAISGVVLAGALILAGTFEGVVVGFAQWLVLRRPIGNLTCQSWIVATGVGAFIAWTLGMIPSTLMSVDTDSAAQTQQMSDAMMYWLAVLMGFVLGLILGIPQWFVLRRYVRRAGWWVLANAIAWAAAMPLTFIGAAVVPANGFGFDAVVIVFLTIALAGATAGAIHGFALVWLLQSHQLEAELASSSEANAELQSTGSAVTKSLGAAGRKASI